MLKGKPCVVQGRLRQDTWDDKDTGKKRSKVEVVATDVTFLGAKSDDNGSRSVDQSNIQAEDFARDGNDIDDQPIDLSEIPF